MKYIIIFTLVLIALATYLLWPTKYEPEDWNSFRDEENALEKKEGIIEPPKDVKAPAIKQKIKKLKAPVFTKQDEAEYFNEIRDIIKDQWKELEECENDFDERFGHLTILDTKELISYLNDTSNLDDFLDKLSTFKGTTPSSAKMIKELAEPIVAQIDPNEIIETVGMVKTCRDFQKGNLLFLLKDVKRKDKKMIKAVLNFLESEVSTLTYPRILLGKVIMLEDFLSTLDIKKSKYPQLKQLNVLFKGFTDKDIRIARNHPAFNLEVQKYYYDFSLIYQKEIQNTLKVIKKDLTR